MFVVRLKRPNEDFDLKAFKSRKGALARFRTAQREMIDGDVEECALFDAEASDPERAVAMINQGNARLIASNSVRRPNASLQPQEIGAMSTLTKLALGAMGQLRAKPAQGDAVPKIALPVPDKAGGMPLMEAIAKRHSAREFAAKELPLPLLSSLLWAADGVNRSDGGRTAPSAMNAQEIDVYVALPSGAYLYDAAANALQLVAGSDLRRVTGYQDFVDEAALDLVYVADHSRMKLVPVGKPREFCFRRRRRDRAKRLSVRRRQRALHRHPRLDRSRRHRQCARTGPRPAGAAVADGGFSEGVTVATADSPAISAPCRRTRRAAFRATHGPDRPRRAA